MFRQGTDMAVEDDVFRPFLEQLVPAFGKRARRADWLLRVDFALHDVEFPVHRRQAALGFDEDHPVHAVGDMHRDRRHGAVVDIEPRVLCLEPERSRFPWRDRRQLGTAARSGCGMEIDVVSVPAVFGVLDAHDDLIANAHPHHRPRNCPVEGPETIDAVGAEMGLDLDRLQIHLDGCRFVALDRRRYVRRVFRYVGHIRVQRVHRIDAVAHRGGEAVMARRPGRPVMLRESGGCAQHPTDGQSGSADKQRATTYVVRSADGLSDPVRIFVRLIVRHN